MKKPTSSTAAASAAVSKKRKERPLTSYFSSTAAASNGASSSLSSSSSPAAAAAVDALLRDRERQRQRHDRARRGNNTATTAAAIQPPAESSIRRRRRRQQQQQQQSSMPVLAKRNGKKVEGDGSMMLLPVHKQQQQKRPLLSHQQQQQQQQQKPFGSKARMTGPPPDYRHPRHAPSSARPSNNEGEDPRGGGPRHQQLTKEGGSGAGQQGERAMTKSSGVAVAVPRSNKVGLRVTLSTTASSSSSSSSSSGGAGGAAERSSTTKREDNPEAATPDENSANPSAIAGTGVAAGGKNACPAATRSDSTTSRGSNLPRTLRKNIIYQLMDRSLLGHNAAGSLAGRPAAICGIRDIGGGGAAAAAAVEIPRSNQAWKVAPWIELNHRIGAASSGAAAAGTIPPTRLLAWDEMGVLLATGLAEHGIIRIYDWDMVWPADQKGRNMACRKNETPGAFGIEPVLSFYVKNNEDGSSNGGPATCSSLTFLAWNKFNPDELLVGTAAGRLFVYDVAALNSWLHQQSSGPPGPQPRRTFVCGANMTGADAVGSALFVNDRRHLLVGSGSKVFCFDAATRKALWKFDWSKRVTCIATVYQNSDIILVGSACGHFCLVNYMQYQMGSFSRFASPKVLSEWLSHRGLESPGLSHMGIRCVLVETVPAPQGTASRRSRITWITSCGWVLRSMIETSATTTTPAAAKSPGTGSSGPARVLFSTAPVTVLNTRGEKVNPSQRSWSLPVGACASHGTRDLLVFEKVAEITQILPHHDNRVMASQPRFVREKSRPCLHLMWTTINVGGHHPTYSPHTCTLSRRKGRPVAVAIHPSHEWIVVATESKGIYALSARATIDTATADSKSKE